MNDKEKAVKDYSDPHHAVSRIVASYARRSDVTQDDIVALSLRLMPVFAQGVETKQGAAIAAAPQDAIARLSPALPISKAVTADKVYCLCCGKGFTMLKRHLKAEHGMTEDEYRAAFNLDADFPLVAPNYSERKAAYAKEVGLGKYNREAEIAAGMPAR